MNDPNPSANAAKHLFWIQRDPLRIGEWRQRHPGKLLDCRGMNLAGESLENRDLSQIDFGGANFRGTQLQGSSLASCKLQGAIFDDAQLVNVNLQGADMSQASFRGANLAGVKLAGSRFAENCFDDARLPGLTVPEGADLIGCSFARAHLNDCTLRALSFKDCNLSRASFRGANCTDSSFDAAILDEASLDHGVFYRCSFRGSHLRGASLEAARLDEADLTGATLLESRVDHASFNKVVGLNLCFHVETVKATSGLPRYMETVVVPTVDRVISWDQLRVVGKLPLFAVSYSALVLMPFLFYLLEVFNNKVGQLRAAAANVDPDGASGQFLLSLASHLHTEPVPRLSFVLFLCTIVLAIGATIYAALCPPRIKEFSKEQWQDQLGRSLIHYLPYTWKHRWARIGCAVCYAVGGAGALFVLLTKIVEALVYLAKAEIG